MADTSSEHSGNELLEVGSLYFDRGDFLIAIQKISKASGLFFVQRDFDQYLECQNLLLRMYGEMGDEANILKIKEDIQDLALREGFELTSKTYYTLGICANYREQYDLALEHFQRALELGLHSDNKKDMCYAILGVATVYANQGKLTDSLKEIYNLKVFFEVLDLSLLKIMTQFLNGKIVYKLGRYEEAIEVYWECYELLKDNKNIAYMVKVLYRMGLAYRELGDINLARVYLKLACRSVDRVSMRPMYEWIKADLETLGITDEKDYDLILNTDSHVVTERRKGRVDFKNQFILLDLLHLFMKKPGTAYSKEELVEQVWKQDYNPSVHDNKIYVTIKRLRKMIEPDYEKPKYVFRGKNGYYLNKSTRVLLQQ